MHALLREQDHVIAAGDWHSDTEYACRAVRHASLLGAELILHTGDFGFLFTDDYLNSLTEACERYGVDIAFVDGNHDSPERLAEFEIDEENGLRMLTPHIAHLPRGFRWTMQGRTWLALGGAVSINQVKLRQGIDWWPEERLLLGEAWRAIDGGPADVMLTHDAPQGARTPLTFAPGTWPEQHEHESEQNRKLIRLVLDKVQPSLLVHGHYHVRYLDQVRGCRVLGLDMNQRPFARNMALIDTKTLAILSVWPLPVS